MAVLLAMASLLAAGCKSDRSSVSPVESVALTGRQFIRVGMTVQYTATATNHDGTNSDGTGSATWIASDTSIVTIAPDGLATAVAPGLATVTATIGTVSDSFDLTVFVAPLPPQSTTNVKVLALSPVTTTDVVTVSATIPVSAVSIGIIVLGTNSNIRR